MNENTKFDFNGKKILLVGFGLEGQASLQYFKSEFINTTIGIADQSEAFHVDGELKSTVFCIYEGVDWLKGISEYDVIIRSPGVPLRLIEESLKISGSNPIVTSATEIFLERNHSKTIGITGTKGKSTTSSLIRDVLVTCGYKVLLVGNIGKPAISLIDEGVDYFIYELSSYQLQDVKFSPHIAIFLNFYPEHLDHHTTIENYFAAKSRIFAFQSENDVSFIGKQLSEKIKIKPKSNLEIIGAADSSFQVENSSVTSRNGSFNFDMNESCLRGHGNLQNILAVFEFADNLGLNLNLVSKAIRGFIPLPHRLEIVSTIGDIQFVNDSISTVPQATINAIDAFNSQIKTLILGGFDRGVDFQELADVILNSNIPLILFFRPSGERICESIKKFGKNSDKVIPEMIFVDSMTEAIEIVLSKNFQKGVCLLSPASPSFGKFKNFEERGKLFKDAVFAQALIRERKIADKYKT